ncbi:MAG: hypothetical protein LQ344_005794 [Seirophora lacunosa]|nr:MAG: hypothetical protein LQ344_005794 [Seirophora lacunosa]
MASMLDSGRYSDLTITCRGRAFYVHRVFLCSASKFFSAACDGGFKEAQDSQIDLSDDDPKTLGRLLQYLYTTDYNDSDDNDVNDHDTAEEADEKGSAADASLTSLLVIAHIDDATSSVTSNVFGKENEDESVIPNASFIMNNAAVYALAEKYDIPALKNLAKEKFEARCRGFRWADANLVVALEMVYSSTPETDRGLRDIMARVCLQHIDESSGKVLDAPQLQELMIKEGALGVDVLVRAHAETRSLREHEMMLVETHEELRDERDNLMDTLDRERAEAARKEEETASIQEEAARIQEEAASIQEGAVRTQQEAARKHVKMAKTISSLRSQLAMATGGINIERKALHDLFWKKTVCGYCESILSLQTVRKISDGRVIREISVICRYCHELQMELFRRPS